jgi:hypothetical protein
MRLNKVKNFSLINSPIYNDFFQKILSITAYFQCDDIKIETYII